MRRWTTSLLLAMALLGSTAGAGQVEEVFDCDPDARVAVRNIAGHVSVRAWSRPEIHILVKTGRDVERVDISRSASNPGVEIVIPKRARGGADIGCQIEVTCPPGVELDLEGISTSVVTAGIRGEIDINTVSGGVKVQDAADDVTIETVSGGVHVSGNMKDLKVTTTSGGVSVEGTAESMEAETVSGSISMIGDVEDARLHTTSSRINLKGNVDSIDAESVSARIEVDRVHKKADIATMSGAIRVIGVLPEDIELEAFSSGVDYEGGLQPGGSMDITSKSGSISVALPANIDATFDIATMSGGIQNDLGTGPQANKRIGPGRELDFTTGDGRGKVELETFSGSVRLKGLPPVALPDLPPLPQLEPLPPLPAQE